jgi:dCMP deaminase
MNWSKYFMSIAYMIAMRSKDESTHIGAVIIDPVDKTILSTGYNSFPRGIDDDVRERQDRPEKYYWMSHAEFNAVCNAARHGIKLNGATVYTNGIPCMNCALSLIQAGIKEVITHKQWNDLNTDIWLEHSKRSEILFKEAGVKLWFYDGDIQGELYALNRGRILKFDKGVSKNE